MYLTIIAKTFLFQVNWFKIQFVQILHKLPITKKRITINCFIGKQRKRIIFQGTYCGFSSSMFPVFMLSFTGTQHIQPQRFTFTLSLTTKQLVSDKLPLKPCCLVVTTTEPFTSFCHGVVNKDFSVFITPLIFYRKTCSVQHQAVKQLSLGRQVFVFFRKQYLGHFEKRFTFRLVIKNINVQVFTSLSVMILISGIKKHPTQK